MTSSGERPAAHGAVAATTAFSPKIDMTHGAAWLIVAGILAGLIAIGSILDRPILNLRRPSPATVALLVIILVLLVVLAFAAYWAVF